MKKINLKNNILVLILIVLLIMVTFILLQNFQEVSKKLAIQKEEFDISNTKYLLENLDIQAKAYSIYDITDKKQIYDKDGDIRLPIASLTKIMTVVVALEDYKKSDEVIISEIPFGDREGGRLALGEKWKISDLSKFTLISSSNDGAFALSEQDSSDFLDRMNDKAKVIGMKKALFLNSTGIDINNERIGAFASPRDINILAEYAFKKYPEVFQATTLPEMKIQTLSGEVHQVYNTNYILDKIPNVLFSKTGNTVMAGGNLVIIFKSKNNHEIAIAVLGSTTLARFTDMEKIINVLQYSYGSRD